MRNLVIITWLLSLILVWFVTKTSVKPETVIVKQQEQIIKYKYKLKESEIKDNARFILRIPFTNFGITKQFSIGFVSGILVGI